MRYFNKYTAYPLIWLVSLYQVTLSPDHSWMRILYPYGFCKFHPTCSMYVKQSLQLHGIFPGLLFSIRRILRCHPWAEPRVDKVPLPPKP